MSIIDLCERGLIPDVFIRAGVRHISQQRLKEHAQLSPQALEDTLAQRRHEWSQGPIAIATQQANDQHYEVPPEFFKQSLGPHLKYSCSYWDKQVQNLEQAELAMLGLYARRAQLNDGQQILDLGCGWGSFSLWAAQRYPKSRITAVSNSAPQRQFIEAQAKARGLQNLRVITADINEYKADQQFDRIISIEMLEHVRNHPLLFGRIAQWLRDDGYFFCHVFCHRQLAYAYEDRGDNDWMSRHFFTGGMMPSYDLFNHYNEHLQIKSQYWIDGRHYEKTSNAWLALCDANKKQLIASLGGGALGRLRLNRWRMFFIAVAEFFGMAQGKEWGVGHYLMQKT